MIIFDLDGTLADCEHRRHFVDPSRSRDHILQGYYGNGKIVEEKGVYCNITDGKRFKPNWLEFYDACDKDRPIWPVIYICRYFHNSNIEVQIWSGRSESVKEKTCEWLENFSVYHDVLKMRPIDDNTPDEILKERWLNEAIEQGCEIEFVLDDRPKVIRMWRRRGVYVFNCNQTEDEF